LKNILEIIGDGELSSQVESLLQFQSSQKINKQSYSQTFSIDTSSDNSLIPSEFNQLNLSENQATEQTSEQQAQILQPAYGIPGSSK